MRKNLVELKRFSTSDYIIQCISVLVWWKDESVYFALQSCFKKKLIDYMTVKTCQNWIQRFKIN